MTRLLVVMAAALFFVGCSQVQSGFNKVHEDVFGCPPVGQEPTRELNAEGPRDEVKRDFMGNECGKPVYTPKCAE